MRNVFVLACGVLLSCSAVGQSFTSSNLPIISIDTHGNSIEDDFKISADMGIIDNGVGQTNTLTDPFNGYNGRIGIELRGSSSQSFPKKPYGIELQDNAGAGISAPLLGMPEEEDWVLNATYNDKSLMRDMLAYKLGRDLGRYAPRTRYCEVVINGEYQGIYILIEKVKRDKNRVDISKLEVTETSGDDLTGGYILKIDKFTGNSEPGFKSFISPPYSVGHTIYFQNEYPKYSDLAFEQDTYMLNFMRDFEEVLNGSTYTDPVHGYRKYINDDSFVDYLIINELSKNVDGYRLSTFMHKDKDSKGGKLTMGPIWDYNLGFGNADYCEGGPTYGWMYNFNVVCGEDGFQVPFWWSRLLTDPAFRHKLNTRWTTLRQTKLKTETIHAYMDSIVNVLDVGARQRNFERWPVFHMYVWPNYQWEQQTTYPLAVSWMKNWISDRAAWIDSNLPAVVTDAEKPQTGFSMNVFPNPFEESLVFEYDLKKPGVVQITLCDILGKEVAVAEKTHTAAGKYQIHFNQISLPKGMYFGKTLFNTVPVSTAKLMRR